MVVPGIGMPTEPTLVCAGVLTVHSDVVWARTAPKASTVNEMPKGGSQRPIVTVTMPPSITISAPKTWSEIASWYAGHARSRYTLDAAASRQVDSVIAGARTRGDTIRALHRWVAQDVRYVSIALGLGGYQPRMPAEVLRTGFGDCKDKATLFIAALARHGIPASPVLLHSGDGADRDRHGIK